MSKIILASASPRRQELLEMLGLDFSIVPSKINEESFAGLAPLELVKQLARAKAEKVAELAEDSLVIGADTIVALDGIVLGKPVDRLAAIEMLKKIQNRKHTVLTGLAIYNTDSAKVIVEYDQTEVYMSPISEKDIINYVNTGEPLDKAGAYGIQGIGGIFVERINGSYYTVMGLPIHKLALMLRDFGISIL